jgi:hypothetical protein
MKHLGLALPLLLPFGALGMHCWLSQQPPARLLVIAFVAADAAILWLYVWRPRIRPSLIPCLYGIASAYLSLEIIYTWVASVKQARDFYAFDLPANLTYDPVMGYKYTGHSARMAYVLNDEIQWSGTLTGNNYGFADADDFSPRRKEGARRVLILGDSLSGEPQYKQLWPDYVEDLAARDGWRLELPNLSMGGYGISNWISLAENLIIKENWDVDEILMPVYEGDDLERQFIIGGQAAGRPFRVYLDRGVIPRPSVDTKAPPVLDPRNFKRWPESLVLSKAEFDRFLRRGKPDRYPPSAKRPKFDRLYLYDAVQQLTTPISSYLKARFAGDSAAIPDGGPRLNVTADMKPIHDRLKAALRRIGKPIAVIYIPYKPEILADDGYLGYNQVKDFAAFVGAKFYDGRDAFRHVSRRERAKYFFRLDAHWNQDGSRLFGDYVYRNILFPHDEGSSTGSQPMVGRKPSFPDRTSARNMATRP